MEPINLEEIRVKYNLSLIIMHGSQITGKTHLKSDLDIAVVRNNNSEIDFLGLLFDLKKFFNTDKIDITDITFADPLLLFAVTQKSRLLAGDVSTYKSLERLSFFKYSDYGYFLKTLQFKSQVCKKLS
jgi:predicted nucleotidyltransferase